MNFELDTLDEANMHQIALQFNTIEPSADGSMYQQANLGDVIEPVVASIYQADPVALGAAALALFLAASMTYIKGI